MSHVGSKMIRIDTTDTPTNLDDLLMAIGQVPIGMFGKPSKDTLEEAIAYMEAHGGGSIKVPIHENINSLIVNVRKDKEGLYRVQFEYTNYRPPIGKEERPYLGGDWRVGDIVHNIDLEHSDDKTIYWYCVESGTPGDWNYISDGEHGAYRDARYIEGEETIVVI